jgi:hypothetical protein
VSGRNAIVRPRVGRRLAGGARNAELASLVELVADFVESSRELIGLATEEGRLCTLGLVDNAEKRSATAFGLLYRVDSLVKHGQPLHSEALGDIIGGKLRGNTRRDS